MSGDDEPDVPFTSRLLPWAIGGLLGLALAFVAIIIAVNSSRSPSLPSGLPSAGNSSSSPSGSDQSRLAKMMAELDELSAKTTVIPIENLDPAYEAQRQQQAAHYLKKYLEAKDRYEPEIKAILKRHPDWTTDGPPSKPKR